MSAAEGNTKNNSEGILSTGLLKAGAVCPFLRVPIERTELIEDASVEVLGTDGINIYFSPEETAGSESVGHMLMHCLLRHVLVPDRVMRPFWDLSCDIAAEYKRTEYFPDPGSESVRMRIEDALPRGVKPGNAEEVYRAVIDMFEEDLSALREAVVRDDHRYWYRPFVPSPEWKEPEGNETSFAFSSPRPHTYFREEESGEDYEEWLEEKFQSFWPDEDELPGGRSLTGEYGLSAGCREEKMILRARGRYDYSRYLKRFSSVREELRINQAEFDFIPYCFGLQRYGNMPLIEALEYTESHKVEELVIAIDTSGSCSTETVEGFLAETESILMHKENFFRRMNVHIVQCDARVQSHAVIRSYGEWKEYLKNLSIRGRGGTDFNPVFELVAKLQREGELKNLKGLLYFTDGNGLYPQEKTPYETAFVFTSKAALGYNIPEWIIPLCLEDGGGL